MKKVNLKFTILFAVILGLQEAKAQELSYYAEGLVKDIQDAKAKLESGEINKSNWLTDQAFSDQAYTIKGALSKGMRGRIYDRLYITNNAKDKKACDDAYGPLAQVATQKGLAFTETDWLKADNPAYGAVLKDIAEVTKDVLDPKIGPLGLPTNEHDWLERAVSKRRYDEWASSFFGGATPEIKNIFNAELDKLKKAAEKVLPATKPSDNLFAIRNKVDEDLMKKEMVTGLTYHKIGLKTPSWLIQKNDLGIPEIRYKQGYMIIRNPEWDHNYCKLCQVNVKQDYAGGGTYGDSYGTVIYCWLMSAQP